MQLLKGSIRSLRRKSIRALANYLEQPSSKNYNPKAVPSPELFKQCLKPCDIILMEGDLRYSEFIKYITQSTWSHCGLYIGDAYEGYEKGDDQKSIIEVLLTDGTVISPIKSYYGFNTRILRPIGLSKADKEKIINYCLERVGTSYDIKNVLDLLKHYLPFMKMFLGRHSSEDFFGSGDPQRVICSSLIAKAFQYAKYPILPNIDMLQESASRRKDSSQREQMETETEILKKRHYSLFSPRDFDMSPFFTVVKPTLEEGFNHKYLRWSEQENEDYF